MCFFPAEKESPDSKPADGKSNAKAGATSSSGNNPFLKHPSYSLSTVTGGSAPKGTGIAINMNEIMKAVSV